MSADQRFSLILVGLGMLGGLMLFILRLIWNISKRNTDIESRLARADERMTDVVNRVHAIDSKMDRRVRFLEEHLWKRKD